MKNPTARKYKHQIPLIISLIIIMMASIMGWYSLRQDIYHPLSEDTVIGAEIVNVSSSIPGRIASIKVTENDAVRRGDVIFTIDPSLYQLRLQQAQAELKMAEAALDSQNRTVKAGQSNAAISGDQIVRARANLELATQTLARLQPLLVKGYVTAQQVDSAATTKLDAEISFQQALKQAEAANALINNTAASEALVTARRAAFAIALRELENTTIRAAHNGLVVGLKVASGEFVIPDQPIFTLIVSDHWHASAFFRETELKHIRPGDCATVYVMADRNRPLKGRVQGIGWGISSQDMVSIPRSLPYVARSLNWVRVAQRFPVRIEIIEPPAELMRVGASAVAVVDNVSGC